MVKYQGHAVPIGRFLYGVMSKAARLVCLGHEEAPVKTQSEPNDNEAGRLQMDLQKMVSDEDSAVGTHINYGFGFVRAQLGINNVEFA